MIELSPCADVRVLIKGAGDLATGVAFRLWRAGFPIVMTELAQPLAIRRAAVLAEAVYAGEARVEDISARRVATLPQIEACWREQMIPLIVSPSSALLAALQPTVVVDAIMAKANTGTTLNDAPLVLALGPGFCAGQDVHAVIETSRGHFLGRVIWHGAAQPNTGAPGEVGGQTKARVIYPPQAGTFHGVRPIGAAVKAGDVVGTVDGVPVLAPTSGVIRGLIHDGLAVTPELKIGDVDPRGIVEHCFTVSDKALAVGGGALEAIIAFLSGRTPVRASSDTR